MKEVSRCVPRTGLAETLTVLTARRGADAGGADSALMRRRTFAPNPGALEMWLYTPQRMEEAAPLVVVLHGGTQTAAAFAADSGWIQLADRLGFAVLAPQQSATNNPNRCFNWFQLDDMRRGDGEPGSIAAMVEDAINVHHLDAERIYITGLSAGGAMTAVMLAAYPELFAGGAIIAGAPYGTSRGVAEAFQTMQGRGGSTPAELAELVADAGGASIELPPLSIWHGDADYLVRPSNADEIARQWAAAQGLALEPDETSPTALHQRSTWRDRQGVARIELNRVAGLGHGVPLETRGDTPLGRTAPYMLQAGVNSTLEIARFWGLAPDTAANEGFVTASRAPSEGPKHTPAFDALGDQVMAAVAGAPPGARAVIEDALARGGLFRRPS